MHGCLVTPCVALLWCVPSPLPCGSILHPGPRWALLRSPSVECEGDVVDGGCQVSCCAVAHHHPGHFSGWQRILAKQTSLCHPLREAPQGKEDAGRPAGMGRQRPARSHALPYCEVAVVLGLLSHPPAILRGSVFCPVTKMLEIRGLCEVFLTTQDLTPHPSGLWLSVTQKREGKLPGKKLCVLSLEDSLRTETWALGLGGGWEVLRGPEGWWMKDGRQGCRLVLKTNLASRFYFRCGK